MTEPVDPPAERRSRAWWPGGGVAGRLNLRQVGDNVVSLDEHRRRGKGRPR